MSAPAAPPRRRVHADDLRALAPWLVSRLTVVVLVLGGGRLLAGGPPGFLPAWDRWDVGLFSKVAAFGYQGYPQDYPDRGAEAFFPGFPLVLRAVHVVVPSWTAAGLLISLVAGAVASVFLARLAALEQIPGTRAVTALVLSPYAVFLFAGYSEALFLALALPGWWCARQRRWAAAGVLVALSTGVRITGVFLAVALLVEYAVAERRWGRAVLWLLTPFAVLAGFFGYLGAVTGDPLRWFHVQQDFWDRSLTLPWESLSTTIAAARDPLQGREYAWSFTAEIVAVGVGLAVTLVLLRRARWGEATYVGLSVAALATSSFYLSVARASLLWWPLWLLVAAAGERRAWVWTGYLCVAAPLMALGVLTFTSGRWVG